MAYSHPQHGNTAEAARLRKEVGKRLKALREAVDKTQREVADECGFDYYTMISQIEGGKTRVPPTAMASYAKALKMDGKDFGKLILQYYDPIMFQLLFGKVDA